MHGQRVSSCLLTAWSQPQSLISLLNLSRPSMGQERVARWHHQPPLPTPTSAGKSAQERFRVLVVGGGAAGVELAMALEHRLRPLLPEGKWVGGL